MPANLPRLLVLAALAALPLFVVASSTANAPFKTRDLLTGIPNAEGVPLAMRVDSTGRPVFAVFVDDGAPATKGHIDVIRCNDTACSTFERHTVVQNVLTENSLGMTLAAGDLPTLAYRRFEGLDGISFFQCSTPTCDSGGTSGAFGFGDTWAGRLLDPEFDGAGLANVPVRIAAYGALYHHCANTDCNSASGALLISHPGQDSDMSLVMGTNGRAIVALQQSDPVATANNGLVAAFCETYVCGAFDVDVRVIDNSNGQVGFVNDVQVNPVTGFPVFAYSDGQSATVKLAFCSNVDCSTAPTIQTIATSLTIRGISLVVSGGRAIVTVSRADGGLTWIRCENAACTDTVAYTIDGPFGGAGDTAPEMAFSDTYGYAVGTFQRDTGAVRLLTAGRLAGFGLDVDCDGNYTSVDVLIIQRALAGFTTNATATAPCTLDIDNDTEITIHDAWQMTMYVVGLLLPN